jgi:hypothetical protein
LGLCRTYKHMMTQKEEKPNWIMNSLKALSPESF